MQEWIYCVIFCVYLPCKSSTRKFPNQLFFFWLSTTTWTETLGWDSQSGHSSCGNRLISPFSHWLSRAVEGFPSSSWGEFLPGQTALLWALCLWAPLARFSQNCRPPSIIPYLQGHWNCDFLPASEWVLENHAWTSGLPFLSVNSVSLRFPPYTLVWAKWNLNYLCM